MACTMVTPIGMYSGDSTSRNVRMCGMYDIMDRLFLSAS